MIFFLFKPFDMLLFQGNESNQDRNFLRNKVAQITSLGFVTDYPHRWPSFFTDLIGILSPSAKAVDIYLRVLLSVDSEVVDREIVHTFEVETQGSCWLSVLKKLI